jgi:hypothetical protein
MLKPITTTRLCFMRLKGSALAAHKAFCPPDFGSPYGLPPKSSAQRPCQCSLPALASEASRVLAQHPTTINHTRKEVVCT